jgi:hypothetical protein
MYLRSLQILEEWNKPVQGRWDQSKILMPTFTPDENAAAWQKHTGLILLVLLLYRVKAPGLLQVRYAIREETR